jgi:tetratricopeptide (TPR) repeat protein
VVRRYPDAAAMLNDLRAFRAGEPTEADRSWLADANEAAVTRRTYRPVDGEASDERTRRTAPVTLAGDASPDVAHDAGAGSPPLAGSALQAGTHAPDAEPTRRTSAGVAVADADATQRTTAPAAVSPTPVAPPPTPPRTRSAAAVAWLRTGRVRVAVLVVVFLVVVGLVWNEASVWSAARELRVGLATRQGPAMNQIWDEYEALARRSLLGVGVAGLRGPLKERLVSQADQVISDYRQDAPAVREAQWRAAADSLTNALRLDPADRTVIASLRYCEGHLQRITGEARARRKLPAGENFHQAIAGFQDAARQNPRWPDPYLGLARTYIYGLDDLDKAIEALKEAEKRGYRPGNRELVQLADGYRSRAARMQKQADAMSGLPQEADCLEKATNDYRQSLDLYGKAIGFGEAGTYLKQVQKQLDGVTARLDRIRQDEAAKESGLKGLLRSLLGGK